MSIGIPRWPGLWLPNYNPIRPGNEGTTPIEIPGVPTGGVATFSVTTALSFNGTSSTLSAPDAAAIRPSTQFTLTGWVRRNTAGTGTKVMFRKWDYTGTTGGFFSVNFAEGTSHDILIPESLTSSGGTLGRWPATLYPVGTWVYFTLVYDGTQGTNAGRLQLWINGVQQTASTFFGTIPSSMQFTGTSHLFRIGASTGGALFAPFDYADTRLYVQRALTGPEINNLYNGIQDLGSLALWYRYAEGSGTVVNDSAGTNTGTSANATYISYP